MRSRYGVDKRIVPSDLGIFFKEAAKEAFFTGASTTIFSVAHLIEADLPFGVPAGRIEFQCFLKVVESLVGAVIDFQDRAQEKVGIRERLGVLGFDGLVQELFAGFDLGGVDLKEAIGVEGHKEAIFGLFFVGALQGGESILKLVLLKELVARVKGVLCWRGGRWDGALGDGDRGWASNGPGGFSFQTLHLFAAPFDVRARVCESGVRD